MYDLFIIDAKLPYLFHFAFIQQYFIGGFFWWMNFVHVTIFKVAKKSRNKFEVLKSYYAILALFFHISQIFCNFLHFLRNNKVESIRKIRYWYNAFASFPLHWIKSIKYHKTWQIGYRERFSSGHRRDFNLPIKKHLVSAFSCFLMHSVHLQWPFAGSIECPQLSE